MRGQHRVWHRMLDEACDLIAPAFASFTKPMRLVAVPREAGGLNLLAVVGGSATPVAAPPADRTARLPVELRLRSDQMLERSLVLPAANRDYLDAIVDHRLERLVPWRRESILYGYTVEGGEGGTLTVRVLLTSAEIAAGPVAALKALGLILPRIGGEADRPGAPLRIAFGRGSAVQRPASQGGFGRPSLTSTAACCLLAGGTTVFAVDADACRTEADRHLLKARRLIREAAEANAPDALPILADKRPERATMVLIDRLAAALPDTSYLRELIIAPVIVHRPIFPAIPFVGGTMTIALPARPIQEAIDAAAGFARQSLSASTLRTYKADWAHFADWCSSAGVDPLPCPPQAIAAYLASMAATRSRATIQRLVSIGQPHKLAGHDRRPSHPAIRNTLRGMFRKHGKPPRKAAALGREEVKMLLDGSVEGLAAVRDRAIFLLGFAGALRRSELAAVRREDLTFRADGVRLLLPRSKGDQEGQGVEIGIPRGTHPSTCPVRALQRWIEASDCGSGPAFRMIRAEGTIMDEALHPSSIRYILRKRAAEAGLEVGRHERLSLRGFRAGFVTEAYKAGARDEEIMDHTRHKDADTMRGYVRRAKLLSESPVRKLGL